jgi:hypothetical protein
MNVSGRWLAGVALAALAGACGGKGSGDAAPAASAAPPSDERWTEVKSEKAPLFISAAEDFPPPEVAWRGELLRVGKQIRTRTWNGYLDDEHAERDGQLFAVRRATGGTESFAFESDLGGEVPVSTTSALCEALAKRGPFDLEACKTNLRRARAADGAVVSYVPCASGACPVAIERGGKLGAIPLFGLSSAQFLWGKKRSVLVAQMRTVKDSGKRSGGSVAILALDGDEPKSLGEFPTDEVDARDPSRVLSKVVTVKVTRAELKLTGKSQVQTADGKVTDEKSIDETHPLPPLD